MLQDVPFYGLIQAAMRCADTDNSHALKRTFPGTWEELQTRYNAPFDGMMPDDPEACECVKLTDLGKVPKFSSDCEKHKHLT